MKKISLFLNTLMVFISCQSVCAYSKDIYKTEEYQEYKSFAKELKKQHDIRFKIEEITEEELRKFNTTDVESLLNNYVPNWQNDNSNNQLNYTPINVNADETTPLIFISFSMPETLIRNYIDEAKAYNGVLVLRGLVNNSLKQTVQKFKLIENIKENQKSNISIIIHPHLFDLYQVKQVPTIVLAQDNLKCVLKYSECSDSYKYDKISGSITIKYALEQIEEKGSLEINRFATYFLKKGESDEI